MTGKIVHLDEARRARVNLKETGLERSGSFLSESERIKIIADSMQLSYAAILELYERVEELESHAQSSER